jgi:hypothetical protein
MNSKELITPKFKATNKAANPDFLTYLNRQELITPKF